MDGRLAKTDRIDAELLARFGMLLEPRMLQENSDILNDLKELHVARLALVKDRTAAKNRQKNITQRLLRKQNEARLKQIEDQLEAVDGAIRALIASQTPPP
ncbi:transposase [Martelella sp. FLE1502]